MIRKILISAAAATIAFSAVPAAAQDQPQQPRTTYELRFLDLAPGKDDRWNEIIETYFMPARKAAGLPDVTIHWLVTGDYDILMPMVMPRGMAAFDEHGGPERRAFHQALVKIVGSEEAATKLYDEMGEIVVRTKSVYSHTHP
ncbi:hypothetical protein [Qipengyuania zhejiangensis]|uniref:hypothetical protein n=1 Tax=Qipengyuania zhejiangensis TaxID=3077782 RepID=UPI002D777C95|nr:hypothetical protein [Qipengyuania sp. Z2]